MNKRTTRLTIKCLLAASLFVFLSTDAQVPQLGHVSDTLWSKDNELSIGREAYNRMLRNGDIYTSQADTDYLNYLGNKIASHAQTRLGLTFYLTRSTTINAFASPGGYIGMNAGLVLATDNEHELAGVAAHEIGHVVQEHIARSVLASKDRQFANGAAMVASILLATQADRELGTAAMMSVVAGEQQRQINDIRHHEIEADKVGRRLMTQADFNELGMQTFFGKLYTPSGQSNTPSFLLTHPLPQRRQAAIDTLKLRSKALRSRDEYYLFRGRIRAEFLPTAELTRIIAIESQSQKPQIRDASIYLSALQAIKGGGINAALSLLETMQTSMRDNRDVQLMRAKLLLLNRQDPDADAIYKELWTRYQGDSVIAYDYAQHLKHNGRLKDAKHILAQAVETTNNPDLHWLYGEVLGKLGDKAAQNHVLIRYYRNMGEYEQALTQAKIAAKYPSMDWQARAGFEAQTKELQRIIDQKKALE